MDYKHEGQAEWDGRQAYMQRLHNVIMQCHISSYTNDYVGWYKSLQILKIELSSHLRTEDEKDLIKNSFTRLRASLFTNQGEMFKMDGFINAQEALHKIMRNRGFDVPISDHSPGQVTR